MPLKKILLILFLLCSVSGYTQEVKKIKITDLEKIIADSKTPLVINFWATFCLPCIAEIPYFQEMTTKYKKDGVQLLLVSLDLNDDYDKILPFAKKRKITAPLAWLNESNADYFIPKIDSGWSGAIPATLFINNKNSYRKFQEKEFSRDELEKEIAALLGKN
jgi:thiol-disulfide isomerase/thioredoxin